MTAHLTPGSGRKDHGFPRDFPKPRTGSDDTLTGLGVVHGESDPARMLSGVLILVFVSIILALMLAWWLI
jgi:hypothetical protein